ncbi:MAG TPA: SIS domain-containing protein [Candidatus Nitrosotenuis sp.]|jgi:D-sedoheptulose 7-phosphate isomerase|nr:SIS domain-containing protein [Candidatus Nitrosotenuis sp.]
MTDFLYPFLQKQSSRPPLDELLAEVRRSSLEKCHEVSELRARVLAEQGPEILAAARTLAASFAAGGRLFTFGNGGSATDAADLAADCRCPPWPGRPSLPALALSQDVATVTALGNDVGFENSFARPLAALGRRGDVALGFSTSGSSANVLAAFAAARRGGLRCIALTGYDGGRCAQLGLDHLLVVPSTHIPRIQEVHATMYHALLDLVHRLLEVGP